jgi:microcystin-dependent protein
MATIPVPGTVVAAGSQVGPSGDTGFTGPQGSAEEVGSIKAWPAAAAPASWLLCDGSAISRTLYPGLFSVIGTNYGTGDGSTTFNLPDMRGRFVLGFGQGAGLANRVLAAVGGEENHQLTVAELAAHTHASFYQTNAAAGSVGTGVGSAGASVPSGSTGGNTPHNTMPPFLVVTYIIKVAPTGGATAQAPIADATQSGLLRQVSGLATDYVGGDNASHPLASILGPALITGNPDAPWTYGAYDDHFDGSTLNAKWSLNAASGLVGSGTSIGGSRVCVSAGNPADATLRVCNLIETVSLSPPVSIRAKLQGIATMAAGTGGVNGFCIGLYNGAVSGNRFRLGLVAGSGFTTTGLTLVLTTEYGANFAGGSSSVLLHGGVAPYWRLDYAADFSTSFWLSYDGINWGRVLATTTGAQTVFTTNPPNTFFIGLLQTQSSNCEIWCDWVRFQ